MSTPYYEARIQASRRDPRLSNRERAAERLYVSVKSLADYETGATVPPCDVVQQMREVYGAHDLVGAHIRNYCPLMTDYGSEEPSELAQAALGWAVAMGDAQEVAHSARWGYFVRCVCHAVGPSSGSRQGQSTISLVR